MKRVLITAVAALLVLPGRRFATAEEAPPHAAIESSPEKGIRLSAAALKSLEVGTEPIGARRETYQIPAGALIYSQDRVGVYRMRDGWFKLIKVVLLGRPAARATVRTAEFKPGDRVATRGVALLRVAEMDIEGGSH